MTFCLC